MSERHSHRFDLLNDSNYAMWALYMVAKLKKHNLWEITSGTATRPLGSPNHKAVRAFIRRQEEACAEIVLHVEPSQLPHCRTDDPVEMWINIAAVHRAHGLSSRLSLRRNFIYMIKDDSISMVSWISRVRAAAYELTAIGASVNNEDVTLVLTQGLPERYDGVVTTLDTTDPDLLTIEYVIERLLGAESQIESRRAASITPASTAPSTPDAGLAARIRTPIEQITCFRCGAKGHYQRTCPHPPPHPTAANAVFTPATPVPARTAFARAGSPLLAF